MAASPTQFASTENHATGERSANPEDPPSKSKSSSGHPCVYLVDDHPPVRRAITSAIESTIDLETCGHATSLNEAFSQLETISPDVIVVDISLPDGHGLDLVKAIHERESETKVIVFSMYDEHVYAERALRAGASGYLMKTEPISELLDAIRRVTRGQMYLSNQMASQILDRRHGGGEPSFAIDELTDREFEVFRMLGQGQTLDEIREELGLCRKTVETYRRRAKEKLGFDSISELLQHAMQWSCGQELDGSKVGAVPSKEVSPSTGS